MTNSPLCNFCLASLSKGVTIRGGANINQDIKYYDLLAKISQIPGQAGHQEPSRQFADFQTSRYPTINNKSYFKVSNNELPQRTGIHRNQQQAAISGCSRRYI